MANYAYAYNGNEEHAAKAVLKDGAISTKVAIEMSNHLRGKRTSAAKASLQRIINQKEALPFKRFTDGLGHKKGNMAAGRYPKKASEAFLQLIENVEANASSKGLADELIITSLVANKASTPYHFGRLRRRQMKRTHVEIVVTEDEKPKAKSKALKKGKVAEEDKKETSAEKKAPTPTATNHKKEQALEKKEAKEAEPKKEGAKE